MSKHTPGPWLHSGETGDGKIQFVESDQEKDNWNCLRAEIESDDCNYEMAVANARLIAAAPELLAACKAWDEGFVEGEQFTPEQFRVWVNERRRMAREAIAKAEGGAA